MKKRSVQSKIQLGSAEIDPTVAVVGMLIFVSAVIGFSYFSPANAEFAVVVASSLPGIAIWSDKLPDNHCFLLGILAGVIIAASFIWVPAEVRQYSLILGGSVASSALWKVFF